MRFRLILCTTCLALAASGGLAGGAQQPPATAEPSRAAAQAAPVRVVGEVVAVDADLRLLSVRADSGDVFTLAFEEGASFLRVPPGEKTLEKAVPTTLPEIGRGDRVYARGVPLSDGRTIPARQLVVMSKAAIDTRHQQEREEWLKRGAAGVVTELRAGKKEIVIQSRGRGLPQPVVVQTAEGTKFRRYAPDSVKFSDAKPSSFTELKVGDQVRALGQQGTESSYKAEQVVSGSFRTIAGKVMTVDSQTNEIKLETVPDRKNVTVVLNTDSVLRRFPKEFAAMMAQRMGGGMGPGGGAAPAGGMRAFGGPQGGSPGSAVVPPARPAPGTPGTERAAGSAGERPSGAPAGAGAGAPQGGMTFRRPTGGGDDLLDRLPPLTVAELKPGDMVMLVSTVGKEPNRVTAVAFVAGVEAFLAMGVMQPQVERLGASQSLGLPGGLDIGVGLP